MPRHPPRAFLRIISFSSDSALVLLHEQLESTIVFVLVLQVLLSLDCFSFIYCRNFNMRPRLSDGASRLGRILELRRLELLTSSLQSWRSTS